MEKLKGLSNLTNGKQILNETICIGTNTLESLQAQKETLETIEDTLEAHENTLNKTMRTLRSMEWFGWIANALDFSTGINNTSNQNNQTENFVNTNWLNTPDTVKTIGNTTHISSSNAIISQQDKDLELIDQALEQLHLISTTMNTYLITNQETLNQVNNKTDKVNGMTLACSLKSAKISGSYGKNQSIQLGTFHFVDVITGAFLAVENNYLILTDKPSLSSQFSCELRNNNLIGIKNVSTLKYIGTTLLGSIKVAGEYWGRMEDCFIDLSGQPTGILVVGRNWGSGAWIKNTTGYNNYFTDSTTGSHDKNSMLVVKACKITNENSN